MRAEALFCIVYMSSAIGHLDDDELASIITTSHRRNLAAQVSGALCYYDGSFLQFLEGPQGAVEDTFSRVSADRRHHNILCVYRRVIERRAFPDWSMALATVGGAAALNRTFVGRLQDLALAPDVAHTSSLEGFLESFRSWLR